MLIEISPFAALQALGGCARECMDPGETCYYMRLGLEDRNASPEAIRKAFRRIALINHPDKVPPEQREEAKQRFQAAQEAFATLSSSEVTQALPVFAFEAKRAEGFIVCSSSCTRRSPRLAGGGAHAHSAPVALKTASV